MRDDELDRILGGDDEIDPSPGFHASVMAAIRREAAAPPPIPFPWTRAVAGAVSVAVALAIAVRFEPTVLEAVSNGVGAPWILFAGLVTAGSLFFTRRLAALRF